MRSVASLEKLGLTEAEAAIFLFLTQHGSSYAPQIQSALEIQKVPTYRALNTLIARDLVITSGDRRRLKYIAEPMQKLLDQYDENIKELHTARDDLERFIDTLANQQNELYKERKIQVYEGVEGFRLWAEERLRSDVSMVREIGNNLFWRDFFSTKEEAEANTIRLGRERAEKKISIRSIFTKDRELPDYARTRPDLLKEVRFLDISSMPSLCLSMFGSRLGFFSGDGVTYRGMIIDDRMLASMLTIIFDLLWQQSEVVEL
jgi:sugar-specific transcriptional regulator TrmB